jgi:glucosylceramidase
LTIGEQVSRNVAYYVIAHAAKFVRPGSLRLHTDGHVPNVAFLTPTGQIVLIALNDNAEPLSFCIRFQGKNANAILPANAVGTYVWHT